MVPEALMPSVYKNHSHLQYLFAESQTRETVKLDISSVNGSGHALPVPKIIKSLSSQLVYPNKTVPDNPSILALNKFKYDDGNSKNISSSNEVDHHPSSENI
jgi:hypothetical protein